MTYHATHLHLFLLLGAPYILQSDNGRLIAAYVRHIEPKPLTEYSKDEQLQSTLHIRFKITITK